MAVVIAISMHARNIAIVAVAASAFLSQLSCDRVRKAAARANTVNEIERLHGCISDRTTDDGVPIEVFLSTVGNPVLLNDDELLRLGPQLRAFEGTEYLDLSNIPVTDKGLAGVEGWDSLTAINLANTRVSFAGLVSLRKSLPRLKTLYLEGVKLNAADLAHIREEVEVK